MRNQFTTTLFIFFINVASCVVSDQTNTETLGRKCEPIQIELCRDIGYNETSVPNFVTNEMHADAEYTLQTFAPLIQYGCSVQLHFFLCSVYVPMCTPKVAMPIGPCRGLCEAVRKRCNPVLEGFGFPWPPALDCNRFPETNNYEHMCMKGPGEPGKYIITPISTSPSIHSSSCHGLAKPHLYVRLNRSARCAPLCDADILFNFRDKQIAEMWVMSWSYAAFGTSMVTIICLIFSDRKWDKFLKPLVYCHILVTIGWAVRWFVGRNLSSCGYDSQLQGVPVLLIDGLSNISCAVTFLLRYYFGMAAIGWWSLLCMEWHWSTRLIRKYLTEPTTHFAQNNNMVGIYFFHSRNGKNDTYKTLVQLAAWGIPALQTTTVVVVRLVDADELLGICFVGNQSDKALGLLVLLPLFFYWAFGTMNLIAGYIRKRYNKLLAAKMGTNFNGVGIFLLIYCIPSAVLLITVFYEYINSTIWISLPQPTLKRAFSVRVPIWPFVVRAFVELLVCIISSAWILGPRISTIYKKCFASNYEQRLSNYPPIAKSTSSYQIVCPAKPLMPFRKLPSSNTCSAHGSRKNRAYKPTTKKEKELSCCIYLANFNNESNNLRVLI